MISAIPIAPITEMSTPVNEVELPNLDAMMSEDSKIEEIEHEESKNVEK